MNYAKSLNPNNIPQSEALPGKDQVENSAGGFVFLVDKWTQLHRFLIGGAEGGTFHIGEQKLVKTNVTSVLACVQEDGPRTVAEIVKVSTQGDAPKNDPAISALAIACANGDAKTKKLAYGAIVKVCRTGTHLFQFFSAIKELRGWSRGLRDGVAAFYTSRTPDQLGMQFVKYRQRDGWTHRDILRLAHPHSGFTATRALFDYVVKRDAGKEYTVPEVPVVVGYEAASKLDKAALKSGDAKVVNELVGLISNGKLPWEALPTEAMGNVAVWVALLPHMGITALIRNLAKMTSIGVLKNGMLNSSVMTVVGKLRDPKTIAESKVHPMQIFTAIKTYESGHGVKGSLSWTPVQQVLDALQAAFYLAFVNVEATGLKYFLGIDVSGSMEKSISPTSNISSREAAAAMALVIANTEPLHAIAGFSCAPGTTWHDGQNLLVPLPIAPSMRLDQVARVLATTPFGRTDCSLPIEYALKEKLQVDVFVILTDNETYAGRRHASVALQEYRKKVNPKAKMIAMAFGTNQFSVADPTDAGMIDVVGFDASVPQIMADFVR